MPYSCITSHGRFIGGGSGMPVMFNTFQGFGTQVDLILLDILDILDFDIILGMDMLDPHHGILYCYAKTITLAIPDISLVVWQGSISQAPIGIISYIQA